MSRPLRVFREDDPSRADPQFFGRIPESAFDDPRLENSDIRVLGVLSYLARMSFPVVRETEKNVARRARLSHATIRKCYDRLEQASYLTRETGYKRAGCPREIRLTFELRAFKLENGMHPSDIKGASKRYRGSGCNRSRGSGCNRYRDSGATLFENLEREKLTDSQAPAHAPARDPSPVEAMPTQSVSLFLPNDQDPNSAAMTTVRAEPDDDPASALIARATAMFSNATDEKVRHEITTHGHEAVAWAIHGAETRTPRPTSWGYVVRTLIISRKEGATRKLTVAPSTSPLPGSPLLAPQPTECVSPPTAESFAETIAYGNERGLGGRSVRAAVLREIQAGRLPAELIAMVPDEWFVSGPPEKPAAGSTFGRSPRGRPESKPG